MKKVTCILMAALMLLSMAACGSSAPEETTGTTAAAETTAPETTAEPTIPTTVPETTVAEPTSEDILEQAKKLYAKLCESKSNGDYDAFAACFTNTSDSEIRGNYDLLLDTSQYDQHFAIYVMQQDEYHVITFVDAIVAGTYPRTSTESYCSNLIVTMTEAGCKFIGNSEVYNSIGLYSVMPEPVVSAMKEGRNAIFFSAVGFAYLDQSFCVEGSLDTNAVCACQDEEGNVFVYLLVSNGTNENRSVYNFRIEMTDSVLGTILSESTDETVIVKKDSCKLVVLKYPAECVKTGSEAWGNVNIRNNNRHK